MGTLQQSPKLLLSLSVKRQLSNSAFEMLMEHKPMQCVHFYYGIHDLQLYKVSVLSSV